MEFHRFLSYDGYSSDDIKSNAVDIKEAQKTALSRRADLDASESVLDGESFLAASLSDSKQVYTLRNSQSNPPTLLVFVP